MVIPDPLCEEVLLASGFEAECAGMCLLESGVVGWRRFGGIVAGVFVCIVYFYV